MQIPVAKDTPIKYAITDFRRALPIFLYLTFERH